MQAKDRHAQVPRSDLNGSRQSGDHIASQIHRRKRSIRKSKDTRRSQVAEEAGTDPLTITRKSIDKGLQVINIDLLEEQARDALQRGVYVFISHGSGKMWTLREPI